MTDIICITKYACGDGCGSGERELEMTLDRDGNRYPISIMFDAGGSETHDPVEAFEMDDDGSGITQFRAGDVITVKVVVVR